MIFRGMFVKLSASSYLSTPADHILLDDNLTLILRAGPYYPQLNEMSFDQTSFFGNHVELNTHQQKTLTTIAEELPRRPTKEYVYTLTKDNVKPEDCYMVSYLAYLFAYSSCLCLHRE